MTRALAVLTLVLALAVPARAQELTGTLKKVKDTGTLSIGYRENSPPFSFVGDDKKPQGYSIDLCTRIATAVQQAVGRDVKVTWVPVTVADRIPAIVSGRIDLECGSTTMTLSRQEQVDFSQMTWVDGGGLLTKAGSGVAGVSDLGGKRVAIIPGTTTEKALIETLRKRVVNVQMVPVKDHDEGRAALQDGRADAYASDRALLIGLLMTAKDRDALSLAEEQFSYEPYGLMLRRGDAPFRLVVNRTLVTLYRGEEIARIYKTWFGRIGRPSNILLLMYLMNALPE
jgi:ABC-type amino acid transport substrate-binding protein